LRVAARPTADPADLGDDAVSASERAVVVAALNRLDAVDRLVIALRHFEQLSEQEMAEVLDVPPGTVKSRLSRAMAKLRTGLAVEVFGNG
jgi:RNA polymerase sigma-70 factor, ECF subfamily